MSICLLYDLSIVATYPSIPAHFAFLFVLFVLLFGVHSCFAGESKQNEGRGLVDRKLNQAHAHPPPGNSFSRRLFCFGSLVILDVACCYLLVILVIYNYTNIY